MRHILGSLLILLPAFAVTTAKTAAPGVPRGSVSSYVRFESSPPVVNVLYRYGHNDSAPSGAYGVNVSAPRNAWYIEEQRAGGTDVVAGVIRHEPDLIAEGLKMFRWGLARQAKDGSFPGSVWPFHGVAFFLSEAAPALVFLNASSYADRFHGETSWQVPRMRRAAYSMMRSVHGVPHIDDPVKNHRYFEAAIALGATGVLSSDRTLKRWSTQYAWKGIHMERSNGVMPENGGHDSGYQALGMINATRYLELVAGGNLAQSLYRALAKGEDWEISRIGSDGAVNQAGDTRTADCVEHNPAGQCKTVFYAPIFSALARWAAITDNSRFQRASQAVWTKSGYGG